MRTTAFLAGLILVGFPGLAAPHGGVYRGPGVGVPAGGAPTAPGTAGTPSGAGGSDVTDWRTWWGVNRDPYLQLKQRIHGAAVTTGFGDHDIGRGERPAVPRSSRPSAEDLDERIVPALVKALAAGRSDDVRSGALLALAKIGRDPRGQRLADLFVPLLKDPSQEIAETAALALGVAADPSAAQLLAELLAGAEEGRRLTARSEVPYRTRAFAAYGLGLIGARTANEDVRRFAVHHLARALEEGVASATRDVQVAAVVSLGLVRLAPERPGSDVPPQEDGHAPAARPPSASRQAQIDHLLAVLDDGARHELVRAHVPVCLARLVQGCEPAALERVARAQGGLLERRADVHTAIQQGAVNGAGLLGDNDQDDLDRWIRARLFDAALQGDRNVKSLATMALARVAGRDGSGGEPEAGLAEVRGFLLRKLARGTTAERPWAALAMGVLERARQDARASLSPDVAPALRIALAENTSLLELGANMIAAGLVRDLEARDTLLARALDPSDDETRGYACVGLGLMGAREAVGPLREIVRSSRYRPGVLRDAAVGLGLLGDRETVPLLIEMLAEGQGLAATAAITAALGAIGDSRTVPPLVEMLDDPDMSDHTRAFAAVALGLVCDKEDLPWNSKLAVDVNLWEPPATLLDPVGGKGVLDLL